MAKKKEEMEEGAPAWMTTYGDMVTLLLCFFVLLVSMSTIQESKFEKAIASLRRSFGVLPFKETMHRIFEQPAIKSSKIVGHVDIQGLEGRHVEVMTIDEKTKIVIGGSILFDKDRAVLKPDAYGKLMEIAEQLRGYPNKIEIRGHASSEPFVQKPPKYRTKWELSWYRAFAVSSFLIERGRIREKRIRIAGSGPFEKTHSNLFTESRDRNRRVEIVVTQRRISLVEDTEEVKK